MGDLLSAAISIAFHGLALAMVLYLISVGLSVTMGLMGFVNLAHGAFAMAGGYAATTLMGRFGLPFAPALAGAIIIVVLASFVLERLLYRRLYGADELDQVLMTMGLIFMTVGAATYFWGPVAQPVHPPDLLSGQIQLGGRGISRLSQLPHPVRRGAGHRAVAGARAHALRGAGPRRGRQPAHGAIDRHQHVAAVRA